MLIGETSTFAIEGVVTEHDNGWVFGNFRWWAGGTPIGDWSDYTDMKGCANWLRSLADESIDRYEAGLMQDSKESVFQRLYDSVMDTGYSDGTPPPFDAIYTRFHLSHVGMSAFERVGMVLVEDAKQQRLLWKDLDSQIVNDVFLPMGTVQRVAQAYVTWFEQEHQAWEHS